ncbi:MAG: hypothetical protein DMG68_05785 [Acidobacteria bacterium]|jgi:hypothetical protein|nr:MAG: hypothetical protein DMG68_05785 [Acidobacteriota bacterium]
MKLRLLVCAAVLILFTVPALADSVPITFTNSGILSGTLPSGVVSTASDLAFYGVVIESGPFATVTFDLGAFTGSLKNGGSFTGGSFLLDSNGPVLFTTAFSGTWSKIGQGLYELVGGFSTTSQGIRYVGLVTQSFQVTFTNGRICLVDLNGSTKINAATVPEPGSLVLVGIGLASLAAPLRRKVLAAARRG